MLLNRFWKNCHGGVAPLFGLSLVPMLLAAGAAVDYTQANATRAAFQSALDSTALMMSKTAAKETNLDAVATTYFTALFAGHNAGNVSVHAVYNPDAGSKLTVTGSASVPLNFSGILGVNQINISATSVSIWGNTRLRVALVLDNTGSMLDYDKIGALKTASHNLLTQLQTAAATPDDVYVSIIPFSKDVNVDPTNVGESWLRWDLWEEVNGNCSSSKYHSRSNCLSHSKVWTPAAHSTWNGCVTDRDQNFDTTNDAPVAGGNLYPTEQYGSCPAPLMGLSNDWTKLSNKIDAMQPNGNTNQAIGLQMGWQSLTAAPFVVPAKDPNYQYNQVVILLTDGLNTQDRWYSNASSIDARQQKTCDNLKAAGITLYTVQVNTGSDPTSTLLQNCASDSSKFFLLTSSGEIVATFGQIGTALSNLRLAM